MAAQYSDFPVSVPSSTASCVPSVISSNIHSEVVDEFNDPSVQSVTHASGQSHAVSNEVEPLLVEVEHPIAHTVENDASEERIDEEILCEPPQMFENEIAQSIDSSSNNLTVIENECAPNSLCDVLTVENASLHGTRDDCDKLNDTISCSCDIDEICVDCYHEKRHALVEFQKKSYSEVVESTINHDTSSCIIDDCKHEHCNNFEPCMDADVDVSVKDHSLESKMHKIPLESPLCSLVGSKGSEILIDKIMHVDESFQQVLSCDLPPDLEKQNNCFESLRASGGSDLKNSPFPSTLQTQENFQNVTVCLTLTDGSNIDFLGCDSYLESIVPKMSLLQLKSLHVSISRWDAAVGLLFSLQAHNWKDPLWYQPPPCILGPLPIDPEPPPPRKFTMGESVLGAKIQIIIEDENFSHKCLKIF